MNAYHLALAGALLLTGCTATQLGAAVDGAAVAITGGSPLTYSDDDISISVPTGYTLTKKPLQNEPNFLFLAQDAGNIKRIVLSRVDTTKYLTTAPETLTIADAPTIMGQAADTFVKSASGTDPAIVSPTHAAVSGGKSAFAMSYTYQSQGQKIAALQVMTYKKPLLYMVLCVDTAGVGDPVTMEQVFNSLTFKR